MKRIGLLVLSLVMIAFFGYAALMQTSAGDYADADQWLWVGIYGGAALLTLLHLARKLPSIVAWLAALAAAGWAVKLSIDLAPDLPPVADLFDSEIAREVGGLVIVAIWMAVMATIRPRAKGDGKKKRK